jgi:type I restriction enzyme M protein
LRHSQLAATAYAGQNGQFRTPRHITAMMVELMQPKPEDNDEDLYLS